MDLISQVTLLGGVTDRATIVGLRGAREVDAALRRETLIRLGRGRYALPAAHGHLKTAVAMSGVLSHRSAAAFWGWAQKRPDGLAEVTVPRNRRVRHGLRAIAIPHWSDLPEEDVVRGVVTSVRRTLIDCMRNLPYDEALAIADSALRAGDLTKQDLLALAASTEGRGRTRIMCVAESATASAANTFESVLRAYADLVPGLDVVPQGPVEVGPELTLHPDLLDPHRRIIIEAEGFQWHGTSSHLTRDCRRYNTFVVAGWLVVRFSWYLVMHRPAYVQRVLLQVLEAARHLAGSGPPRHANVARAA